MDTSKGAMALVTRFNAVNSPQEGATPIPCF